MARRRDQRSQSIANHAPTRDPPEAARLTEALDLLSHGHPRTLTRWQDLLHFAMLIIGLRDTPENAEKTGPAYQPDSEGGLRERQCSDETCEESKNNEENGHANPSLSRLPSNVADKLPAPKATVSFIGLLGCSSSPVTFLVGEQVTLRDGIRTLCLNAVDFLDSADGPVNSADVPPVAGSTLRLEETLVGAGK